MITLAATKFLAAFGGRYSIELSFDFPLQVKVTLMDHIDKPTVKVYVQVLPLDGHVIDVELLSFMRKKIEEG